MMDTYDPRQHQQPQIAHPHYQNYNPSPYPSVPLSTSPSLLPPESVYSGTTSARSGSAQSSYAGSAHSSPEGTYLDDFAPNYSTAIPSNTNSKPLANSSLSAHSIAVTPATSTPLNAQAGSGDPSGSAAGAAGMSMQSQSPSPTVVNGTQLSRPLTHKEQELLSHLDRLKFFLATAPSRWSDSEIPSDGESGLGMLGTGRVQQGTPMMPHTNLHPALNRFLLPSGEYVTCVLWSGLYHITGTDIVRALVFRFEAFGRPVRNMKKFEEGVFSDLRNLKPGSDACLEEPKSPFLDLLFKYQCIRTQKKQKVFYWFSVPHDRLFLDALERDLKREKMGLEPTTQVVGEPALSFTYDPKRTLYEQFSKAQGAVEGEGELETAVRRAEEQHRELQAQRSQAPVPEDIGADSAHAPGSRKSTMDYPSRPGSSAGEAPAAGAQGSGTRFMSMFSLFEGSPNYKQRRKKGPKSGGKPGSGLARDSSEEDRDALGNDELVHDFDGDMSIAAVFEAQTGLGGAVNRQEQAKKQADAQRMVQAQHLASLQMQHAGAHARPAHRTASAGTSSMYIGDRQSQYPGRAMHPSLANPGSQHPMLAHPPRSHADARHTFPMMAERHPHVHNSLPPSVVGSPGTLPLNAAAGQPGQQQRAAPAGSAPKTKAFVCPLFSCGRLFKRMEHLKRHLRTHTMEKPYQCEVCQRRFSRADNLNQHVRTHARDGSGANGTMANDNGGDADVEEEDLELDPSMFNNAAYGDAMSMGMSGIDYQSYEIEVPEGGQDVHFEEDDLTQPAQLTGGSGYYTDTPHFAHVVMSPESSPKLNPTAQLQGESPGVQWATQQASSNPYASPQPSPAFSTISSPSPQAAAISHSVASMMLSAPTSGSYRMHGTDFAGSISAPSHKQAFDHSSLYPPSLAMQNSTSSGPGPIRRYRSVTPTIARATESVRRPSTANTAESFTGVPRGYHPYAISASGSTHSSPAPFNAPLAEYQTAVAVQQAQAEQQRALAGSRQGSHSHSRSNSGHLPEDVNSLLNMDATGSLGFVDTNSTTSAPSNSFVDVYGQSQDSTTGYMFNVGEMNMNDAGQYTTNGVDPNGY